MSIKITTNPWQKFKSLIPGGQRTVVTVTTLNGDGTSTVTLANGGTMLARGENVAAGQKALMIDGEIRQQLPALSTESITLY